MNSHFEAHSIKNLHRKLDAGQFALPKLQRTFVWDGPKAAKLLDSVYRQMPVGGLVVWDSSRKNRELLRVSGGLLPAYAPHNERVWFLLDGQQRLSVLHRIRVGDVVQNGRRKGVDFHRVVFRVTDGNDESRFAYRLPVNQQWVPLETVLASNWRTRLQGLTKGQLNRVKECRSRVLLYKLPITRVSTDDLDHARELFLRINSTGTPVGPADKAFARASEFDLRERAETAWSSLPSHFQGLSHEVMLQTRALIDGIEDVGERAMEQVAVLWNQKLQADRARAGNEFARTWLRQQQAMQRAIDFLYANFEVRHHNLLPSRYMVTTLALYFYQYPKRPTPFDAAQLKAWFWATALGQRYSGRGYRTNILKDASYLMKLGAEHTGEFKMDEWIEPSEILRASYGQRSSVSDAFWCLLLRRRPRSLLDGQELELDKLASAANAKHKHHFFPRALLKRWGVSNARINSVLNLCLIPADENCGFGAKHPSTYLSPYKNERFFPRALRSHLLPDLREFEGRLAGPDLFREFLRLRQQSVLAAFEQEAGIRLFSRETAQRQGASKAVV